jgi:hypothetical protein
MTKILKRLEARRLVRRADNPDDRRGSLISPTRQGLAAQDRIFSALLDASQDLLAPLSEKENREADRSLRKLLHTFEAHHWSRIAQASRRGQIVRTEEVREEMREAVMSGEPAACDLPGAPNLEPERSPAQPEIDLLDDSPEALIESYAAHGWGDGLPMIAPTAQRVEAMLAAGCAAEDPDAVIATLPPRLGLATRRLLAVNAVLAGCPPGLLPVLVTAIRALAQPEVNLRGVNATTHPVAPLVIVHGAAVDALGFNAGLGTFGPGNRANASLGRAVRLSLLHLAGARPGDGDASTQGQPSKYSYCIAENAAATPWESYPQSRGVTSASAVTIHCGENPHNFHDMESHQPGPILDKGASVMATLGSNNGPVSFAEFFVVLGPEHAATLAQAGWGRGDVQSYLYERARLPAGRFRRAFEVTQCRPWQAALDDEAPMPITSHPDNIRVIVAGGAGKHSSVIPSWGMTKSVTLPLEP